MSKKFIMPKEVYSGKDALRDSSANFKKYGIKALIVTDQIMMKLGNVEKLTDLLNKGGIEYSIYPEVNSEPTDTIVDHGLIQYQTEACDFMIAIGGGSPIDSMKAIAMLACVNKPLSSMMGKEFEQVRPKMIAIPTTAGTGSESTQFTIITDTTNNVKMLLKGSSLIPDLAIIDPIFTLSVPQAITAATGLDALCHAVEAYTSRKAQSLTDTFALSAIKKIFKYLPICYLEPTNELARAEMALAAFEAGCAFNNSSVTIIHGMSRPIGANFHIAHGLSNAVLMEKCLRYVREPINQKLAEIARFAQLTDTIDDSIASNDFFLALNKLLSVLNIPLLKDVIKDREAYFSLIDKMADDAMISGSPSNTIYNVTLEDVKKIYFDVFNQ